MNILFVIPYVPSLIRARSYNLIKGITNNGHNVNVATLWTGNSELKDLNYLESQGIAVHGVSLPKWRSLINCLREIPGQLPLQAVYCWQPALLATIDRLLQETKNSKNQIDIVHVEHLRGARFAEHIRKKYPSQPVVWDSVDSISYLFRQASRLSRRRTSRFIAQFETSRTENYEGWLSTQFDRTLVTSTPDKQALVDLGGKFGGSGRIDVIPNGVDLDYFHPQPHLVREKNRIVLSGKMSYHANVSMALYMAQQVMPLVWGKIDDVKLVIVGKDPTDEVKSLSAESRIEVTGTVPDIRPFLNTASLAVAPLIYGAGSQFKVLEAMACETPVITTSKGVAALNVISGNEIVIADEPDTFAQQIVNLLTNPDISAQIGRAGRSYVETCHNWQTISQTLTDIYREVILEHRNKTQ